MKDYILELTPEEAFKYGSVIASGLLGVYIAAKRIFGTKGPTGANRRCSKCGLCKHKLFAMLKLWIREINHKNWKCCNDYKTAIAKDMITIKLETGISYLQKSFCHMQRLATKEEIKTEYEETIYTLVELYTNKWEDAGINPIIIKKVSKFHDTNVKYSLRLAMMELERDYTTTTECLRNMLNALIVPYMMFILDVRNILDSANGELIDDVYKGIKNDNVCLTISLPQTRMSFIED